MTNFGSFRRVFVVFGAFRFRVHGSGFGGVGFGELGGTI